MRVMRRARYRPENTVLVSRILAHVLTLICNAASVQKQCVSLKEGHTVFLGNLYCGSVFPIPTNSTRALSSSNVHLCLFTGDFLNGLTIDLATRHLAV